MGGTGATSEIDELAGYLRALTADVPVRDLVSRYDTTRALWTQYRAGTRIVPWHLLERVVVDRTPDRMYRMIALSQARQLYDRAEASAVRAESVRSETPKRQPEAHPRRWGVAAVGLTLIACAMAVSASAPSEGVENAPTGLFAMSADRRAVLWWDEGNGSWVTVGGPKESLLAGGAGVFATEPSSGRILRYGGHPGDWVVVGERASDLAVSDVYLYRLSPERDMVWQWAPTTAAWTIIGGPAAKLYAGGAGLYSVDEEGRLSRYEGTPGAWTVLGPPGDPDDSYAVGRERVYRRSGDGMVWEWAEESWRWIGGPAKTIHAGGAGLFALNMQDSAVYHYDGAPDAWTRIGDPAAELAVADDRVYRLSANRRVVSCWRNSPPAWTVLRGATPRFGATAPR
ncbi:hypothetical protein V5P93_005507 [Actinokineospora auranticolor]|uniref:Uncharacterized protein n=1 Tax=Actinokineospora auranticolor TaxID=155976 RepID=A0A2S6GQB8_9PSEU|nr:hypothetical protein [Actinokineospora auranticolor]PPK67462.1 hypothetical protein CLV40_107126 [Actinokineospora auranticolor]